MKIITMFLLPILLLLGACSSNPSLPATSSPISQSGSYEVSAADDAIDVDLGVRAIVTALIPTGNMYDYSWENPSEVAPDDLIDFCAFNNFVGLPVFPSEDTIRSGASYLNNAASAEEVESAVQIYFEVTVEHLRQSERYQKTNNTYTMYSGWGGGCHYVPMSAKEVDQLIKIEIGKSIVLAPPTEVMGILTVQKQENDTIKYLSYELLK